MRDPKGEFRSRVYTDRPDYADFDAPQKFQAITGIIMTRLRQHPKAICSYSGGSDSDILIDLIERARMIAPSLPPVKYVFFNTGLEMKATKDHVKETAEKYGVEIETIRPEIGIVQATRKCGLPFISKAVSDGFEEWQKKPVPLKIGDEYDRAEDKRAKRQELAEKYPRSGFLINFICCCDRKGDPMQNRQLGINSSKFMRDFVMENPPDFKISARCCDYCKKKTAKKAEEAFEMRITGERRAEGGLRSVNRGGSSCFSETSDGKYIFKPLYYVTDTEKAWYKENYGIRYSDAYEVYGLKRTGCCGCPINYRAVDDLEMIGKYEPNLKKAAWNVFGDSYRYRQKYNEYKAERMRQEAIERENVPGQMNILDFLEEVDA